MDKPKINTHYYFIELNEQGDAYGIAEKENHLDQDDLYNIASKNWALHPKDLEERTFDILKSLTCLSDEEVSAMMWQQSANTD